jgi:Mrp family chromosome partitioning ATPase
MQRDTFIGALQRRWWVVVVAVVLGGIAGALPSPRKAADSASTYSATHTLLISSTDPSGQITSDTISESQIVLLTTVGEVPKAVAKELGQSNAASLAAQIQVNLDQTSNSLSITTTQAAPELAVKIADAFADQLTTYLATRQDDLREQRLSAANDRLTSLQTQIQTLSRDAAASPSDKVIQAKLDAASSRYSTVFAEADALQSEPKIISLVTLQAAEAVPVKQQGLRAPGSRTSRGLFLALIGGLVGLAVVVALNLFDRRIRQRAQAEAILGVPVQMTIPVANRPTDRGLSVRRDRHDPISDAYRAMRSVLALAHNDRADKTKAPVTLVLSSGPADGKTTASLNIAAAFVEAGSRTVAVNTDFRRPALSRAAEVVDVETSAPEALPNMPLRVSPTVAGLRVYDERLQDRDSPPGDLARKVVQITPWLKSHYDEVIIDSPPVSLAAEVLELLSVADTIVVMVRLGHTRIDAAAKTAETLRALGISNFLLAVIGGATDRGNAYYSYGYSRGFEYGPRPRSEADLYEPY